MAEKNVLKAAADRPTVARAQKNVLRAVSTAERPAVFHVVTVPSTLRAFFVGHARFQAANGYEVHAVCAPGVDADHFAREAGCNVHQIPMARQITPFQDAVSVYSLWTLLRQRRPDVLHTHTPKGGLLGSIAGWLARVPNRVYTVHGLVHTARTGLMRHMMLWTERISCALAHEVLSVSPSVREQLVADGICPPEKVRVIGEGSFGGVDVERFRRSPEVNAAAGRWRERLGLNPGTPVLGFVGRLTRDKGIDELIAAWRSLREEIPELRLLLVGAPEALDSLSDATRSALGDPHVHAVGLQADVAPLLALMDVLALPSYREGFGMALIEAAAMEVPVVATRIPGCVDAVEEGVTGLLVEPQRSGPLAAALRELFANPARRQAMGAAARTRVVERFRQEALWDELVAFYDSRRSARS